MTQSPGITVTFCDEDNGSCHLSYQSASRVAQLLVGKPAELVPDLLGSLFAVCPSAQQLAARLAIAENGGSKLSDKEIASMMRSVRFETIREHCVRILLDWPLALEEEPPRSALAQIINLTRDGDAARLAFHIEEAIFECSAENWLAIETLDELVDWINQADNAAARYVHDGLRAEKLALEIGDALPPLLDKYRSMPVVMALRDNPVLACHIARLIDLATLVCEIKSGDCDASRKQLSDTKSVSCSRGELVHHVSIADAVISSYEIRSPTDTVFGIGGLGEKWLEQVSKTSPERRIDIAHSVMRALDPCVEFAIEVR
ncbi:hypothetical protein INR77_13850 [Erythrobacter sp. SCSIO 43205]|uniref:hypothetical protein n=1 Tax=Erythrobacter sp. SCSIO 43205 TaxID=2779361 RepID=UPI001CA9C68D|nr:hypothetical protein [Erythrobacter sp. SCSIO 43205]UAB77844.1 hypothetical protein INR77_13850 [Erythrobacter sp. SCSIO 43205]